ncbi:MAG: hypothetical protein LLF80_06135 [Porphyromonadaceae bacterium]|nr:hypothetical protein [Porphyromonadaceae bacterium]
MKETIFDQRLYDQLEEGTFNARYNLNQALEQLRLEGFPTDLQTIRELTKDEDSFKNYIVKLQRERLSGGFIPITEREIVIQAFSDLYDRLAGKIQSLRSSLQTSLILKEDGSTVVADEDAMQEKLVEKATVRIDTKRAQAYYDKLIALINAHKELTSHEKKNGFDRLVTLKFNDMYPFSFPLERDGTVSEEVFLHAMRNRLKK